MSMGVAGAAKYPLLLLASTLNAALYLSTLDDDDDEQARGSGRLFRTSLQLAGK